MAGSSVTETAVLRGPVKVIILSCVGDDTDGSIPRTAIATKISGKLLALETNPGATAPTANYDIVLNDADGIDVLGGAGANRHTTSSEKVALPFGTYFGVPVAYDDVLTLVITNQSVNDAIIVIRLYFEGDVNR